MRERSAQCLWTARSGPPLSTAMDRREGPPPAYYNTIPQYDSELALVQLFHWHTSGAPRRRKKRSWTVDTAVPTLQERERADFNNQNPGIEGQSLRAQWPHISTSFAQLSACRVPSGTSEQSCSWGWSLHLEWRTSP